MLQDRFVRWPTQNPWWGLLPGNLGIQRVIIIGSDERAWGYAQPCAARGRREMKRRAKRGKGGCREENMCDKAKGGKSGEGEESDSGAREGLRETDTAEARDTRRRR